MSPVTNTRVSVTAKAGPSPCTPNLAELDGSSAPRAFLMVPSSTCIQLKRLRVGVSAMRRLSVWIRRAAYVSR